MKKSFASLMMIVGLALVLIVAAGCNRPDSAAALDTPAAPQAVQPTLPPAEQPTLPPGEMPNDLQATMAAESGLTPAVPAPTDTPLPAVQPTPVPPAPVVSTPSEPEATLAPVATSTPASPTGEVIYTVESGDRLFSIARAYSVSPYAIAATNNIPAPYVIYPGQKLKIPTSGGDGGTPAPTPSGGGRTYVVQPGDNLFRISLKFGVSMQAIAAANGISNVSIVYVGQVLKIP